MSKKQSFKDKCFKDEKGDVVLAQKWNLPIATWAGATLIGLIVEQGVLGNLLDIIGFGALFTWAWLELFQGLNYFRRTIGFVVLVFIIVSRL